MDAASWKQLLKRIKGMEDKAPRYRQGVVTATTPLSVAVGGSDIPYTDVATLNTAIAIGDPVAVLTFGHDLLVLGAIGGDLSTGAPGADGADGAPGAAGPAGASTMWLPPSGALMENWPRGFLGGTNQSIDSGSLKLLGGFTLKAGVAHSSVTFLCASTAGFAGHSWAGIVRVSDRQLMAVSADDTTAWTANTTRTFTFTTPYTPVVDEAVWIGLLYQTVGATPQLVAPGSASTLLPSFLYTVAPVWYGDSDSGLTTPLAVGTIVTAPTGIQRLPYYMYLS